MKTTKFKNSEIGPIPEEWEVKRVGDCAELKNGYAFKSSTYVANGAYQVVTIANVQDGHFAPEDANGISVLPGDLQNHQKLKIGDILISMTGNVGRVCIVDRNSCLLNQRVGLLAVGKNISKDYFYFGLRDKRFLSSMIDKGQGGAQPNIGKKDIESYLIPVPPRTEQEKIAEALSDVDELLAAMATLIEKKRAIKQGAMQELLEVRPTALTQRTQSAQRTAKTLRTLANSAFFASAPAGENPVNPVNLVEKTYAPRRRLAGFTGAWVERRLGDCGEFIGGGTPSTTAPEYWGGDIDWYTPAEIGTAKYATSSERKITKDGLKNSAARLLPVGTILLTTRASIGLSAILRREATTNQGFQSLVVNEEFDCEFMFYFLSTIVREMECRASGSTFLEISSSKLKEIPVIVPPSLSEQKAIAGVLADMDEEIAALEAKRAKYEQIKQGMMQELLTGKTRLEA